MVLGKDYDRFHVGRGGEGNIHREGLDGGSGVDGGKGHGVDGHGKEGVKEKAKEMVGLGKK